MRGLRSGPGKLPGRRCRLRSRDRPGRGIPFPPHGGAPRPAPRRRREAPGIPGSGRRPEPHRMPALALVSGNAQQRVGGAVEQPRRALRAATAGWSTSVNSTPSAVGGTARSPHCMEPVCPVAVVGDSPRSCAGRSARARISSASCPSTTITGEQRAAEEPHQTVQEGFVAHKRSSALGMPMRRDSPAARMSPRAAAHFSSTARGASSARMDIESERQLEAALRRTAIISAVTEMAISSGEMAPISRPMGA